MPTQLQRVDDPVDDRKIDLTNELAERRRVIAVSPVPNGSRVRVYYEGRLFRQIFKIGREHGYVPTEQNTEDVKDARSRIRAFTGRWESFEQDKLDYIDMSPCDVHEFTCDWCEKRKRGKPHATRYKPKKQQTEGFPKEMWTLCRECDPEYKKENGEWVHQTVDNHPRLGTIA